MPGGQRPGDGLADRSGAAGEAVAGEVSVAAAGRGQDRLAPVVQALDGGDGQRPGVPGSADEQVGFAGQHVTTADGGIGQPPGNNGSSICHSRSGDLVIYPRRRADQDEPARTHS